jgi:hypothetical protein
MGIGKKEKSKSIALGGIKNPYKMIGIIVFLPLLIIAVVGMVRLFTAKYPFDLDNCPKHGWWKGHQFTKTEKRVYQNCFGKTVGHTEVIETCECGKTHSYNYDYSGFFD